MHKSIRPGQIACVWITEPHPGARPGARAGATEAVRVSGNMLWLDLIMKSGFRAQLILSAIAAHRVLAFCEQAPGDSAPLLEPPFLDRLGVRW